jgi:hypothetical protein
MQTEETANQFTPRNWLAVAAVSCFPVRIENTATMRAGSRQRGHAYAPGQPPQALNPRPPGRAEVAGRGENINRR